ncbi:protein SUPPRESSOR OF MAX2 1-like [Andrographis paniculata]|uniref:protein SUPPRESSOR OF MAX2 1-like n=1 Tax=Andrographis paniculata TaxID=175694 RepID=UPI0021E90B8C|nr:protein SUPPRESSOR OF MAX2 1-like [Andrographis paniculata]
MRAAAGLAAIQHTLSPEAAGVVNQSIAEAGRRNHGQTTPLHVAATLLASPSGFLRQACIRSHPNSSHPLQCRALELCFSVALERLATAAQNMPEPPAGAEPPLSNALMAALKRAQANQRRGCPEPPPPQPPPQLLAVKVELDQLIISILDDPSVSRVMREAGFSSPAVKATVEQLSIAGKPSNANTTSFLLNHCAANTTPFWLQKRNLKLDEELERVLEIMSRAKKRNPILVGSSDQSEAVVKSLIKRIENKELGIFQNAKVITIGKCSYKELGTKIEDMINNGGTVVLDLGDLKWLVDPPEIQSPAAAELSKLLAKFSGIGAGEDNSLWFIGIASSETYLRCQVYHSSMETDWDLQAVPMSSRWPLSGMFPRVSMDPPTTALGQSWHMLSDFGRNIELCSQCREDYEKDLAKLMAVENSFCEATQSTLPPWMQDTKPKNDHRSQRNDGAVLSKKKDQELRRKWKDTCLHLHPNFHQKVHRSPSPMMFMATSYDSNSIAGLMSLQPTLPAMKPFGQLNTDQTSRGILRRDSPPQSPVRTDLVLGRKEGERLSKKVTEDLLGCICSDVWTKSNDKLVAAFDIDVYKKLLKDLTAYAWWQAEAASAVASIISRRKLGDSKRRGAGTRGDLWLLFVGPDRAAKKKMASVVGEHVSGTSPIVISLGSPRDDKEVCATHRGKTVIDQISEVVQRNPFSVIVLDDVDEANVFVRGSVVRAIETGRLVDFYGRSVTLGNVVFILLGNWSRSGFEARYIDEEKLAALASRNWQLGIVVKAKNAKRRAISPHSEETRPLKPRKEVGTFTVSLDLTLAPKDDQMDGCDYNTSDITVDHDNEVGQQCSFTSVPSELIDNVDEFIVFKPIETRLALREIKKKISSKFSVIVDENLSVEVEDRVLEKIFSGLWLDQMSLDEWIDSVLAPSLDQLKPRLHARVGIAPVVQLVVEIDRRDGPRKSKCNGEWLPSIILV